jgi:amino-acid N-acetyltransferase
VPDRPQQSTEPCSGASETFRTSDGRRVTLRAAQPEDREQALALLGELGLPADGVAEWLACFRVAECEGRIVGVAGMERYRDGGLLRSVAVAPEWRGSGLGRALVDLVMEDGRSAGVQEVYLLTTTAEHYFPRLGFVRVDRTTVPASVRASVEFTSACPASAVVMRRAIAR